jgi:hypothetical protein
VLGLDTHAPDVRMPIARGNYTSTRRERQLLRAMYAYEDIVAFVDHHGRSGGADDSMLSALQYFTITCGDDFIGLVTLTPFDVPNYVSYCERGYERMGHKSKFVAETNMSAVSFCSGAFVPALAQASQIDAEHASFVDTINFALHKVPSPFDGCTIDPWSRVNTIDYPFRQGANANIDGGAEAEAGTPALFPTYVLTWNLGKAVTRVGWSHKFYTDDDARAIKRGQAFSLAQDASHMPLLREISQVVRQITHGEETKHDANDTSERYKLHTSCHYRESPIIDSFFRDRYGPSAPEAIRTVAAMVLNIQSIPAIMLTDRLHNIIAIDLGHGVVAHQSVRESDAMATRFLPYAPPPPMHDLSRALATTGYTPIEPLSADAKRALERDIVEMSLHDEPEHKYDGSDNLHPPPTLALDARGHIVDDAGPQFVSLKPRAPRSGSVPRKRKTSFTRPRKPAAHDKIIKHRRSQSHKGYRAAPRLTTGVGVIVEELLKRSLTFFIKFWGEIAISVLFAFIEGRNLPLSIFHFTAHYLLASAPLTVAIAGHALANHFSAVMQRHRINPTLEAGSYRSAIACACALFSAFTTGWDCVAHCYVVAVFFVLHYSDALTPRFRRRTRLDNLREYLRRAVTRNAPLAFFCTLFAAKRFHDHLHAARAPALSIVHGFGVRLKRRVISFFSTTRMTTHVQGRAKRPQSQPRPAATKRRSATRLRQPSLTPFRPSRTPWNAAAVAERKLQLYQAIVAARRRRAPGNIFSTLLSAASSLYTSVTGGSIVADAAKLGTKVIAYATNWLGDKITPKQEAVIGEPVQHELDAAREHKRRVRSVPLLRAPSNAPAVLQPVKHVERKQAPLSLKHGPYTHASTRQGLVAKVFATASARAAADGKTSFPAPVQLDNQLPNMGFSMEMGVGHSKDDIILRGTEYVTTITVTDAAAAGDIIFRTQIAPSAFNFLPRVEALAPLYTQYDETVEFEVCPICPTDTGGGHVSFYTTDPDESLDGLNADEKLRAAFMHPGAVSNNWWTPTVIPQPSRPPTDLFISPGSDERLVSAGQYTMVATGAAASSATDIAVLLIRYTIRFKIARLDAGQSRIGGYYFGANTAASIADPGSATVMGADSTMSVTWNAAPASGYSSFTADLGGGTWYLEFQGIYTNTASTLVAVPSAPKWLVLSSTYSSNVETFTPTLSSFVNSACYGTPFAAASCTAMYVRQGLMLRAVDPSRESTVAIVFATSGCITAGSVTALTSVYSLFVSSNIMPPPSSLESLREKVAHAAVQVTQMEDILKAYERTHPEPPEDFVLTQAPSPAKHLVIHEPLESKQTKIASLKGR